MSTQTYGAAQMQEAEDSRITLIGAGTIGLSFAAFHVQHLKDASNLTICDVRPDLETYVLETLPRYLAASQHALISQIRLSSDVSSAVRHADIVQEQGPENIAFKQQIWQQVEASAPRNALLWSSTSGIPASQQCEKMEDKSRLTVVHPYNPPHIMPLLEVVPSPSTSVDVLDRTLAFWRERDRQPIVIKKECTGFVANRLAFALLREGIHLVNEGVVTVEELDTVVTSSMGPRWSVWGPFKSYHAGGGPAGLKGFFNNIGGTVQDCWDDIGRENVSDGWEKQVFEQSQNAYGQVDTSERDEKTKRVLQITRGS